MRTFWRPWATFRRWGLATAFVTAIAGCQGSHSEQSTTDSPPTPETRRDRRESRNDRRTDDSKQGEGRGEVGDASVAPDGSSQAAGEAEGSPGTTGRTAAESASPDLKRASELRKLALEDERAGEKREAYEKILKAWSLARTQPEEPGSASVIQSLHDDLSRLRGELNAGADPSGPNKPIRVR